MIVVMGDVPGGAVIPQGDGGASLVFNRRRPAITAHRMPNQMTASVDPRIIGTRIFEISFVDCI